MAGLDLVTEREGDIGRLGSILGELAQVSNVGIERSACDYSVPWEAKRIVEEIIIEGRDRRFVISIGPNGEITDIYQHDEYRPEDKERHRPAGFTHNSRIPFEDFEKEAAAIANQNQFTHPDQLREYFQKEFPKLDIDVSMNLISQAVGSIDDYVSGRKGDLESTIVRKITDSTSNDTVARIKLNHVVNPFEPSQQYVFKVYSSENRAKKDMRVTEKLRQDEVLQLYLPEIHRLGEAGYVKYKGHYLVLQEDFTQKTIPRDEHKEEVMGKISRKIGMSYDWLMEDEFVHNLYLGAIFNSRACKYLGKEELLLYHAPAVRPVGDIETNLLSNANGDYRRIKGAVQGILGEYKHSYDVSSDSSSPIHVGVSQGDFHEQNIVEARNGHGICDLERARIGTPEEDLSYAFMGFPHLLQNKSYSKLFILMMEEEGAELLHDNPEILQANVLGLLPLSYDRVESFRVSTGQQTFGDFVKERRSFFNIVKPQLECQYQA